MPDAGVMATILLILGLFLLALELMIPSFGMIGILSAISLLISAWCAWQAWWGTSPGFFWTYAAFWLLGIPAALGGALFLLQNTSLGDRLVLRGPPKTEDTTQKKVHALEKLIGSIGVSKSLLTPGGMVEIEDQRYHAESRGMAIEPDTPIKVIELKGNRLVVRICDPSEQMAERTTRKAEDTVKPDVPDSPAETIVAADLTEAALSAAEEDSAGILDFEIPED